MWIGVIFLCFPLKITVFFFLATSSFEAYGHQDLIQNYNFSRIQKRSTNLHVCGIPGVYIQKIAMNSINIFKERLWLNNCIVLTRKNRQLFPATLICKESIAKKWHNTFFTNWRCRFLFSHLSLPGQNKPFFATHVVNIFYPSDMQYTELSISLDLWVIILAEI